MCHFIADWRMNDVLTSYTVSILVTDHNIFFEYSFKNVNDYKIKFLNDKICFNRNQF